MLTSTTMAWYKVGDKMGVTMHGDYTCFASVVNRSGCCPRLILVVPQEVYVMELL